MCHDLLLAHPESQNLHIVPTARDPLTSLALSSRNAYLSPDELLVAPILITILRAAETLWKAGRTKGECIAQAVEVFTATKGEWGGELKLNYVHMNNSRTFDELPDGAVLETGGGSDAAREGVTIISGAVWVGKTRLIDNILAGGAKPEGA